MKIVAEKPKAYRTESGVDAEGAENYLTLSGARIVARKFRLESSDGPPYPVVLCESQKSRFRRDLTTVQRSN
jgi:hypothetical protein